MIHMSRETIETSRKFCVTRADAVRPACAHCSARGRYIIDIEMRTDGFGGVTAAGVHLETARTFDARGASIPPARVARITLHYISAIQMHYH